jgi:hypothetical protein
MRQRPGNQEPWLARDMAAPLEHASTAWRHRHPIGEQYCLFTEHTQARWLSVARAYLRGIGLPAVELIQVGKAYFVGDRHHRISAAAALGQQEVDALVSIWQMAEPIHEQRPVVERSPPGRSRAFLARLAWRFALDA